MQQSAFPLSWPIGWKRVPPALRKPGRFGTRKNYARYTEDITVSESVARILRQLEMFGVPDYLVIISSNVPLRRDGLPASGQREPADPGAAVYWRAAAGADQVIAVDIYTHVADNLAAIAATLDAMRAIERHGGAEILQRTFTGFTALPPPPAGRQWWDVLRCDPRATVAEIQASYRILARELHPDKVGGSADAMAELNQAREEALDGRG